MRPFVAWIVALLPAVSGAAACAADAPAPATCSARSGTLAPRVVELYTSEGCSSCPPADRWLSGLRTRADVVALAFHVDYWDRLGWIDRHADPAWTRRQHEASGRSGRGFVYTPQVLLDGRDYRGWPALPPAAEPARVALSLQRDGGAYAARVVRLAGAPPALAGYWAVTEDGHVSEVRAGENRGATLRHDAVVRELQAVPDVGDTVLRFAPRSAAGSARRHVLFVVTDAASGRRFRRCRSAAKPSAGGELMTCFKWHGQVTVVMPFWGDRRVSRPPRVQARSNLRSLTQVRVTQ